MFTLFVTRCNGLERVKRVLSFTEITENYGFFSVRLPPYQFLKAVLRIRADFFRIRIRIRESGFKISDPDPYGHPFFILK